MSSITISNVTKRFGSTVAVDDVSLRVESGDLFFLLGPSGCGKTTLLRMLAGFVDPTGGTIRFGERDVTHTPPNKRNVGMVFQSYALWPHMTVAENVAFGLNVRRVAGSEVGDRVMQALNLVQMGPLAERKPNELSGGQQQRVALARALVIKPTVLLLDEPLSNLDAKLRLDMRTELRRLVTETGITTVYVTHDQKEALSMADNMAVLQAGRIMQTGPPRELYDHPSSRFVADFLGETNFISAVVDDATDGAVWLETPAGRLRSTNGLAATPAGGNVTCSLRPEAMQLRPGPAEFNGLEGRRVHSMYLGEMAQHVIELEDGTIVKQFELNPTHLGDAGDAMHLFIDPKDVVILTD